MITFGEASSPVSFQTVPEATRSGVPSASSVPPYRLPRRHDVIPSPLPEAPRCEQSGLPRTPKWHRACPSSVGIPRQSPHAIRGPRAGFPQPCRAFCCALSWKPKNQPESWEGQTTYSRHGHARSIRLQIWPSYSVQGQYRDSQAMTRHSTDIGILYHAETYGQSSRVSYPWT